MERVSQPRSILRVGHVRAANRATVLRLLRRHRQLSRAELARRTSLSDAAVSRIIAELVLQDLIVELGSGPETGGRPGVRLALNEDRFKAIGVDIQDFETRVSLGTVTGRVLTTERFRTPSNPTEALEKIAASVRPICESLVHPPVGIGVSTRGLVDNRTGVAELGSNPAWIHVEMRAYLAGRTGMPVFVENNVRAAALAEYVFGSADVQGAQCLLFLMVSEGVGMAIVLNDKVYRGPRMAAGEIGQMVISDRGGPERDNRPGCLEMLASDAATCERYNALAGMKTRASSSSYAQQIRQICQLAMEGDPAARAALNESARYLGLGIFNAVWALDADAIVIDGTMTEAWPLVSAAIREQFPEGPQFLNFRNLVLRPSALGGEASLIGAITVPFAPLFASEESPV
jgi:predicted NBD/HSP70 family sugar kinase